MQYDFRSRLQHFFEHPDTLQAKLFSALLIVIILLSVLVSMTSTLHGLSVFECDMLCYAEYLFASIFAVEYLFRLYAAPDRKAYLFSFYGMIDLLAIVPVFFVGMQQHNSLVLRILRLLSLIRVLKIIRYWGDLVLLLVALKQSQRLLLVVVMCAVALAVIGGNLIYYIEPDNFNSAYDGVWWALVTMSTVGYGDMVPNSPLGKLLAGFGMFLGIGIFAVITATIGSKIHVLTEKRNMHCQFCRDVIPVSSQYCMHCGREHITK